MQISNNFSSSIIPGGHNRPNTVNKNSLGSNDSVTKVTQEQAENKQNKSAIIVDEQALEQFEQSQASLLTKSKDNFSFEQSFASQDQPLAKNETAVANYQAVGNLAQRESVQKMFGVDIFA